MANTMLVIIVGIAYFVATASSFGGSEIWKEKLGRSLCNHTKSEEDSKIYGECLAEKCPGVDNPTNTSELHHKCNLTKAEYTEIMQCSWKKSGMLNEDGSCNVEKQLEMANTKCVYENDEIKNKVLDVIKECAKEDNKNCGEAIHCQIRKTFQICYPDADVSAFQRKD